MSIRRTRKNQPEYELQRAVVSYIKVKYPNILINGSAGGVRTSMSQAIKLKATGSSKGFPDLDGQAYCGCALELKVKGNYATKEQKEWIAKLQKNGYYAEVINRINWYLGDEKKVEKKRKNSKHTKKK